MRHDWEEQTICGDVDERFELLSAYLDGEVTASERQQVEALLADDTAFRSQYRQMQRVQIAIPAMSVPSTNQSAETLANAVFAQIDRHRTAQRTRLIGGGAIAATFVAVIAGVGSLFSTDSQLQMASSRLTTPAPMMVALNDPILSLSSEDDGIEIQMTSPEVKADEVK